MLKKITVLIFFLTIAVVYFHNLTRDIYSGDVGDLVTAAVVGGVAHPPGYPLFTLLGFLLNKLPLVIPPVTKVGLISVFASLAGLVVLYKFSLQITKNIFLSLLTVSILSFSYLYWLNAEIPEVFALNNFFVMILIYVNYRFYLTGERRFLFLLAFLSGLSLTHHHTILFLFPALLVLVGKHLKLVFLNKKNLFISILLFLAGFSVYSYVFFAALKNPPINWDNPVNLKNFIHLILRKDYGFAPNIVNKAVPLEVKFIHLITYLKNLVLIFSYQVIFIFIIGAVGLFKKDKYLFLALSLAYFLTGPFFIYYAGTAVTSVQGMGVIERFYVFSTVILMFFVPYGFLLIKNYLDEKLSNKKYSYILLGYFLIVPVLMFKYNLPKTDLSKTEIGNILAKNVLNSLPPKSVLFLSGDTTTFNTWYAYYVLGWRRDIDIVNPPGVGNNIYLDSEINKYKKKYPKTAVNKIISLTLDEILKKRPIFANKSINPLPKNTVLVPRGLVFQVVKKEDIQAKVSYLSDFEKNWRKVKIYRNETLNISEQNFITPEMPLIYSNALVHVGDFLDTNYKDPETAEHYYRRALWIDKTNTQAYSGLSISLYKAYRDCGAAIENMKMALTLYPIWKAYHVRLYYLYKQCKVNKSIIQQYKKQFKRQFNLDVEKQIKL